MPGGALCATGFFVPGWSAQEGEEGELLFRGRARKRVSTPPIVFAGLCAVYIVIVANNLKFALKESNPG